MLSTRFTAIVGCSVPIQQAAMGGVSGPELAGAVARAGGLGMLPQRGIEDTPSRVKRALELAAGGRGSVGMGFFAFRVDEDLENLDLAAASLRLVEFFWGWPDSVLVDRVHAGGALCGWQVGSIDEAKAAADAGCDLVIAQGVESGGHVRGTAPLFVLLDGVLPAVNVPVVAAGAIGTSRAMAAALAAGASAVRVGTRLVASEESYAHRLYKQALIDATGDGTVMTEAFHVGWPDAQHRVLATSLAAAENVAPDTVVATLRKGDVTRVIHLFETSAPTRWMTGDIASMPFYAGQGVGSIDAILPAEQLLRELSEGAEALLAAWG
jgi:nitronate monooxygenase